MYLNVSRQPVKYTTYIRDAAGGDDAQQRTYGAWWSRFSQPDPYDGSYNLADPQSFNRYAYVQNDPVNFTDPTGLFVLPGVTFFNCTNCVMNVVGSLPGGLFGGGGGGGRLAEQAIEQSVDGIGDVSGGEVTQDGQPIPPGNLAQNVANLLTGDCGKFANSLYEKIAGMNPDQPAHSQTFNLLDVFNMVNGRQGGVVFQPVVVGGRPAGGTVSGAIGNAQYPATIYISPIMNYSVITPVGRNFAEYSYAMTAVHETFHLAGRNGGYGDERMARAVHALTGAPGLPKDGADVYEWSRYWNEVLRSKCPQRR